MNAIILRRRKLGRTSCKEIKNFSKHDVKVVRNDKYNSLVSIHKFNYLFRWGCTSPVLEDCCIINKVKAIHLVNDKTTFRDILNDEGLCPKTWFDIWDDNITYPCIIRPKNHHQGRKLFFCNNHSELHGVAFSCGENYYISEYIDKVAEYRVFVVQGRCVCVAKKTPADENTIAWNVAQGGKFENVRWSDWPLKAVKTSIQAFNLSGLDFGGVDVMVDKDGNCYVLEINSAPSLTSHYRQECFAKAFDYIIENGVKHFQNIDELPKGGYQKFIHPAIKENA